MFQGKEWTDSLRISAKMLVGLLDAGESLGEFVQESARGTVS